jgi:hypothetical protein
VDMALLVGRPAEILLLIQIARQEFFTVRL